MTSTEPRDTDAASGPPPQPGGLPQELCRACYQLWARRLIVGQQGIVTAEVERLRYLTTPPAKRRADLQPDDLLRVDLSGIEIAGGEVAITPEDWLAQRLAYQAALKLDASSQTSDDRPAIHATALVTPPFVMALHHVDPEGHVIALSSFGQLPVVGLDDQAACEKAIMAHPLVLLTGCGLLASAATLQQCLDYIELAEYHAWIEFAIRGHEQSAP